MKRSLNKGHIDIFSFMENISVLDKYIKNKEVL